MFTLAVDYDGTLFEGMYPEIGEPRPDVIAKTKEFIAAGAEVALWTCREGKSLREAIRRCKEQGLEFISFNDNTPAQKEYNRRNQMLGEDAFAQRKIYADLYVDDKAPGSIDFFLKLDVAKTMKKFEDEKSS